LTRWLLAHAIHLAPLLWLGAWFARMKYRERQARRARAQPAPRHAAPAPAFGTGRTGLVGVVVACSVGAAAIHGAVIGEHFRESALYGWFFVLAALAQLLWAALVARRADRDLLLAGALGNTLVIVLWAVTRIAGLPLGPEPWRPETVGPPDAFATLLEVGLVTGSLALLRINAFRFSSNE
jgi:hypothetical protein